MAKLIVRKKGAREIEVSISTPVFTIGRLRENSLAIKGDVKVSRRHTKIEFIKNKFYVIDLKSANGTYVNDRLINTRTSINDGDKLVVGNTEMMFFSEGGIAEGSLHTDSEVKPINIEELKKELKPNQVSSVAPKEVASAPAKEEEKLGAVELNPRSTPVKLPRLEEIKPTVKDEPKKKLISFAESEESTVNCPRCGSIIDVSSIPKGAKVGCAKCKHIFTV